MVTFKVLDSERLCTIMCNGAGLHAGAAAEQYICSSLHSLNVIIVRHQSSVSSEAEAHAMFHLQEELKRVISILSVLFCFKLEFRLI